MAEKIYVLSRSEAIAKGQTHYFTGKPCKHGHIARRTVLKSTCTLCALRTGKKWLQENRDDNNFRRRESYKKNPDVRRQQNREWENAHRAEKRIRGQRRYQKNLEAERLRTKAKKLKQPEKYAEYRRNRYARRKGAGGKHSAKDVANILQKQGGRCAVCRCDVARKYHVDHINPIRRGGTNDRSNIQVLCPLCNLNKNAKDPVEFMQSRGFLL